MQVIWRKQLTKLHIEEKRECKELAQKHLSGVPNACSTSGFHPIINAGNSDNSTNLPFAKFIR